jgi:hypothetical protein
VASIEILFPSDTTLTSVTRWNTDNLPAHVKGIAQWETVGRYTGYYIPGSLTKNNKPIPIEFINNSWFSLVFIESEQSFFTRKTQSIARENTYGLGFWALTDPEHPEYTTPEPIATDPPEESPTFGPTDPSRPASRASSTGALSYQSHTNSPVAQTINLFPGLPTITLSSMSVNTTTPAGGSGGGGGGTGTGTGAIPPHGNGGMRGVPLSVFDGKRSNADEFWAQFRRYKLINRTHDSMTKPFDRVLTALTYIRGPMINDWVNAQEEHLADRTDSTKRGWVRESDEILWQEFEDAFKAAWTDTSKKQNAYDQLMRLTMQGWDIDTYIATFDRLAQAAGWTLDSEGTIVHFQEGLHKMIHSKALDQDKIPRMIDEWKATARNEVARAKEKYNAGLTGAQRRNQQKPQDFGNFQNQSNQPRPQQLNPNHVPMDVDAVNATQFKKLTPEEWAQLAKEGRCFRCCLQGHMARNCLKNVNYNNSTIRTNETPATTKESTPAPVPTTQTSTPNNPANKLTRAQQIRNIEEAMNNEERSEYLDACNMGQDFWSAGA